MRNAKINMSMEVFARLVGFHLTKRNMVSKMLSSEYLAGFFDGEGCVLIADRKSRNGRKRNYYLQVVLSQKKSDVLYQIKEQYNCFIKKYHGGDAYFLVLRNQHAVSFLKDVLPYLVVKLDEAILALAFYKRLNKVGKQLTDEELIVREKMKRELQCLKRKK